MAGRVMVAVVLMAALAGTSSAARSADVENALQEQAKQPPTVVFNVAPMSERIEIDGGKNPEMIPQWDVWKAAFLIIDKTSDVPTIVWKASSKDEVAAIVDAARENAGNERACEARLAKLVEILKTDEARFINERTQELNLDCRWQILRLRDRLLTGLSPGSRAVLSDYVESLKAGIRVFVPKGELAFYRQPQ